MASSKTIEPDWEVVTQKALDREAEQALSVLGADDFVFTPSPTAVSVLDEQQGVRGELGSDATLPQMQSPSKLPPFMQGFDADMLKWDLQAPPSLWKAPPDFCKENGVDLGVFSELPHVNIQPKSDLEMPKHLPDFNPLLPPTRAPLLPKLSPPFCPEPPASPSADPGVLLQFHELDQQGHNETFALPPTVHGKNAAFEPDLPSPEPILHMLRKAVSELPSSHELLMCSTPGPFKPLKVENQVLENQELPSLPPPVRPDLDLKTPLKPRGLKKRKRGPKRVTAGRRKARSTKRVKREEEEEYKPPKEAPGLVVLEPEDEEREFVPPPPGDHHLPFPTDFPPEILPPVFPALPTPKTEPSSGSKLLSKSGKKPTRKPKRKSPKNPDKPHVCTICGKRFRYISHLQTHNAVHTGIKAFPCDICGKFFTRKDNIKPHQVLMHSRIKNHACPKCPKRFALKGYLTLHLATHRWRESGQKPFACGNCGKRFGRKAHRNRHEKKCMQQKLAATKAS